MTFSRRPRVFLSYRHEERRPGLSGDSYNRKHRQWVADFAKALSAWNVDVIWDDRLRSLFKPHTRTDPAKLPFLAEVSTLCLQSAQAFAPIMTEGYVERIIGGDGAGTVSEEWRNALAGQKAGQLEIITIVREWPIVDVPAPPLEIERKRSWDFRFIQPSKEEVELLADSFHLAWTIHRPPVDMPYARLISAYLKFCVQQFRLPWPGIETWGCDFDRPRVFLDVMRQLKSGVLGDAPGAGRSTVEFDLFGEMEGEDAYDDEAQGTHAMMQQAFSTVAATRVGFDFPAKASVKVKGLYFGPTLKEFSYR